MDEFLGITLRIDAVVDKYVIGRMGYLRKFSPWPWFDGEDYRYGLSYELLPSTSTGSVDLCYITVDDTYQILGTRTTAQIVRELSGEDIFSTPKIEDAIDMFEKVILEIGRRFPESIAEV